MSLPDHIRKQLVLPAFCAPMFLVSTPELVREACIAGLIGGLPRHNARSLEQFESWLQQIHSARQQAAEEGRPTGVLAVNLASKAPAEEMEANLALCQSYGVDIIVNATGNPAELTKRSHDHGLLVFADAINLRFAEKAIAAGVDGITAIGSGGGGHSGTLSHFALVPKIREMFDGTIVMAGCVSNGAAIRAAEILGADLAYMGTRFIATRESGATEAYKALLQSESANDLIYTDRVSGIAANWLQSSLRGAGLNPDQLPEWEPGKPYGQTQLPAEAKPWINIWSAGQGIELIEDIPSVKELVNRLSDEYQQACSIAAFNGFRSHR